MARKSNPTISQQTPLNANPPAPDPRDRTTFHFQMTPVRRALTSSVKLIYRAFARLEAFDADKLPGEGPLILAANHLSNYDVFPLQFALSRPIFFMGKAELFQNPVLGWLLRELGGFPVFRGERDEWAIQQAQKVLEHGQVLGMFPEGARNRGKGLRPAKTGIARLALTVGCPILPAALHGPQHMFRRFPQRTTIVVRFGNLLWPESGETHLSLTDRVMFSLAEMLPPEARGAYSYRPPGF